MKNKSTTLDLDAARAELESIKTELSRFAENQIHHWTNVMALRELVGEAEKFAIVNCQWASGTGGERYDVPAARHRLFALTRDSAELRHLGTLRAMLAVAEAHADYKTAAEFIQPRMDRKTDLETAIGAEEHRRLAEADARAAELAAAEAEAVAAVRRQFATV